MKERCKDLIGRRVRIRRFITLRSGRTIEPGQLGQIYQTWRGRFSIDRIPATPGDNDPLILHAWRSDFDLL